MKTNTKPRCPHCGEFALTETEERILAALYTAPFWPTLAQLIERVGCTERTVRCAITKLPALIMSDAQHRDGLLHYELTLEGRRAAENLAGRDTAAA